MKWLHRLRPLHDNPQLTGFALTIVAMAAPDLLRGLKKTTAADFSTAASELTS
jgi:hypothetical protein